ncbi:unnamed protein product [Linum tenue]|uniref:Uncharacterized protein n=1 Tax=Linum tenue TaxID=586396 RepID=A0AAV0KY74_9ROSI|nr:unnamed protein product [Linum tenue]
MGRRRKGW